MLLNINMYKGYCDKNITKIIIPMLASLGLNYLYLSKYKKKDLPMQEHDFDVHILSILV